MKHVPLFRGKRRPVLLAAALGAAFAASASAAASDPPRSATISAESAAQSLNQAWRIGNDATIEVHNVRGSVVVAAGEPGQATLSGELGVGSKLIVDGSEQRLDLRVESSREHGLFGNNGPQSDSNIVLKVPSGVSLRLELVSADGKVTGIDGKSLKAECVSGKLTIDSGSPEIDIESVSGDIALNATHPGAGHRAHLQAVSGDIEVNGASGRVKLDTVSGRALAKGGEVQEFEAGTVSGSIELAAAIGKHGRVQADTMSGDIRVELREPVSAHIEAQTFSGGIRSDFGRVEKPEYGPGSSLDARVGDADAQLNLKSFSGNVDVRKQ